MLAHRAGPDAFFSYQIYGAISPARTLSPCEQRVRSGLWGGSPGWVGGGGSEQQLQLGGRAAGSGGPSGLSRVSPHQGPGLWRSEVRGQRWR